MAISKKSTPFVLSLWNLVKIITSWADFFYQISWGKDENCRFFTDGQFLNVSRFLLLRLYQALTHYLWPNSKHIPNRGRSWPYHDIYNWMSSFDFDCYISRTAKWIWLQLFDLGSRFEPAYQHILFSFGNKLGNKEFLRKECEPGYFILDFFQIFNNETKK